MTDDPATFSVEAQARDPRSMLALHRALLALRRAEPALHLGAWAAVDAPVGVVAFDRWVAGGARLRVLLNLTGVPVTVPLDGRWTVELSTGLDQAPGEPDGGAVALRADEGLVLRAR
jgi:alpha-glucosidase